MREFDFGVTDDAEDEFEQLVPNAPSSCDLSSEDASAVVQTTRRGPSLKARAVDFLSRREHSRLELRRKLQRHSDDLNEIDTLLNELEKENWQSDERYAQSLVNRRAYKFGIRRVAQELKQNGVNDALIELVREQLQDSEFERALEVWERKFGSAPIDQKAYAKQYRFMASRGFNPDALRRILDRLKGSF